MLCKSSSRLKCASDAFFLAKSRWVEVFVWIADTVVAVTSMRLALEPFPVSHTLHTTEYVQIQWKHSLLRSKTFKDSAHASDRVHSIPWQSKLGSSGPA